MQSRSNIRSQLCLDQGDVWFARPVRRQIDSEDQENDADHGESLKVEEAEQRGTLVGSGARDQKNTVLANQGREKEKMQDSDSAESETNIFESLDIDECRRTVYEHPPL